MRDGRRTESEGQGMARCGHSHQRRGGKACMPQLWICLNERPLLTLSSSEQWPELNCRPNAYTPPLPLPPTTNPQVWRRVPGQMARLRGGGQVRANLTA